MIHFSRAIHCVPAARMRMFALPLRGIYQLADEVLLVYFANVAAIKMTVLANIVVFISLFCVQYGAAYFIHIDAHAEECFFDKVSSGTKMSLIFEVAEGGFLDIDVKVRGQLLHDMRVVMLFTLTHRHTFRKYIDALTHSLPLHTPLNPH
jgi:hypothetical protein